MEFGGVCETLISCPQLAFGRQREKGREINVEWNYIRPDSRELHA